MRNSLWQHSKLLLKKSSKLSLKLHDMIKSQAMETQVSFILSHVRVLVEFEINNFCAPPGLTFKAGAEAISAKLNEGEISKTDVVQAFNTISAIIDKAMGGTSGGLFSIFFAGLSRGFLEAQGGNEVATAAMWARALEVRFFFGSLVSYIFPKLTFSLVSSLSIHSTIIPLPVPLPEPSSILCPVSFLLLPPT